MEVQLNKSESLTLTKGVDYMKYAAYVALSLLSDVTCAFVSPGAADKVMSLANMIVRKMRTQKK